MPNRWEMPPQYVSTGNPETVDDPTPPYAGLIGSRYTAIIMPREAAGAEAGRSKTYQYVQTDSTMSVSPFPGAVAWWADKTSYLVTTTVTTLGRGRIAGVFQNAVTKGNYGYIQIGGPATVKFVDAPTAVPTAAGLFVIPSATNGKADCLAAGSTPTYPPLGTSASGLAGGTSEGIVDLDVPQTT